MWERARDMAAPFTIKTMPEETLLAFTDHGTVGAMMPADCGDSDQVIFPLCQVGLDVKGLASDLQSQGVGAFDKS